MAPDDSRSFARVWATVTDDRRRRADERRSGDQLSDVWKSFAPHRIIPASSLDIARGERPRSSARRARGKTTLFTLSSGRFRLRRDDRTELRTHRFGAATTQQPLVLSRSYPDQLDLFTADACFSRICGCALFCGRKAKPLFVLRSSPAAPCRGRAH